MMAIPASAAQAAAFSYSDLPKSGPLAMVSAMAGVRNMLDYVALTSGESLVVLAEFTVDQHVVQAIASGAAFVGAKVSVLYVPPFAAGGAHNSSDLVGSLLQSVDVIISCTYWGEVHCEQLFFDKIYASKCRVLSLHQSATMSMLETGARFPTELYMKIEEKAFEQFSRAKTVHVTCLGGTDLTWTNQQFTPSRRFTPGRGLWRPYPPGGINWNGGDVNGTLVIVDSTATGVPAAPVVLTVVDSKVSDATGDRIGVRDTLSFAPQGYYVRHALIGLNPKVRVAGGTQFEREKHAGSFYLGLDGLHDGKADQSRPGLAHNDVQFDRPTIWMDEEKVVEDGELLLLIREDFRALASSAEQRETLFNCNPRVPVPDVLLQ